MSLNTKILALTLCSVAALTFRVDAHPHQVPPGQVYRSLESGAPVRAAGTLHGIIDAVDYAAGVIIVRSGNRVEPVAIVPSTTVYGRDGYAGVSDLRRGQNVDISVFEVGGRLVAQSVLVH